MTGPDPRHRRPVPPAGGSPLRASVSRRPGDPSESGHYAYQSLQVAYREQSEDVSWQIAENPAYTLMLDGHLYLRSATTLDAQANLNALLDAISVTTLEKGLDTIGGGIFNLLILDKRRRVLTVLGDRLGLMPLYYVEDADGVHLSGNSFAFRDRFGLSEAAVVEFLKYGYLPFAPSLFEDVQRLLPGQMLTISLDSRRVSRSTPRVFEFKPLAHRIHDLPEAVALLDGALERFFDRCSRGSYTVELRGDDASRLTASRLRPFAPTLLSFDPPYSSAASRVLRFAERLGLPADIRTLPVDLLETSAIRLDQRFRLALGMENADLLHLCQVLPYGTPDYYVDSFLGDDLLGGAFYQLAGDSVLGYLFGDVAFNTSVREITTYQDHLYNGPRTLSDAELSGILHPEYEVWFLNAARGVLEINRNAGHTHEDYLESLALYTHVRNHRAGRLVCAAAQTGAVSPFLDYDVQQVCFDTDKSLRADRQLRDAYLRRHAPEIAGDPVWATDNAILDRRRLYRLRQVISPSRRVGFPEPTPVERLSERTVARRFRRRGARSELREAAVRPPADMPAAIVARIEELAGEGRLHPRLYLRYLSLLCLAG